MYGIAKNHSDKSHPHTIRILNNFQGFTRKTLGRLEEKEYIAIQGKLWSMTEKGYQKAENLYKKDNTDE